MPALSLDTVYRTLATFEKLSLVHRVETVESQARYEALTTRHHHFLCDTCGQVFDFVWHSFDAMTLPSGLAEIGAIARTSVVVHGTCAACARKEQKNDTPGTDCPANNHLNALASRPFPSQATACLLLPAAALSRLTQEVFLLKFCFTAKRE